VPELREMFEGECGREGMIQDDIGYARHIAVAGHRDERNLHAFRKCGVHSDQPFDGALLKKEGILFNEILAVSVAYDEIEVTFLKKMILNSRHHQSRVTFADFRHDDADRITALLPEGSGELVRPVVQFLGSGTD